jgi:hypothetical protein
MLLSAVPSIRTPFVEKGRTAFSAGLVIATLSTETENTAELVLPALSSAVTITSVAPGGKRLPLGRE